MSAPSQTYLEVGAEYENRRDSLLGLGVAGNYILTSPGITLLAVPELFLHPLAGDWIIHGAPLLEFGESTGTHGGARLGTRVPIPLGLISLLPSLTLDFINGGENVTLGLGIVL